MHLIIGGAYQGKLAFAKNCLGVKEIFTCGEDGKVDFSRSCVDKIEEFVLVCVKEKVDAVQIFKEHKEEWKDSVLICQDIFCGVVPIEDDYREWRQATAALCQYLSREAEQVSRIFCGLEQRLK